MAASPLADSISTARKELSDLIRQKNCAPLLLRLAWHDAGTYDANTCTGGPNGSIHFKEEYEREENKGLEIAVQTLCEPIKKRYPDMSYADFYQLAGVVAVEMSGGPKIEFLSGRTDAKAVSPPGRLPVATGDATHLRDVFHRMGFGDKEIVVLSGGHTLGQAHRDRSGFDGAWTTEPTKFDNSYFSELLRDAPNKDYIQLPTDRCLAADKSFRKYVEMYAKDKELFFKEYATAHKKLSELGFKQFPEAKRKTDLKESIIIVATFTVIIALLGYLYEAMRR